MEWIIQDIKHNSLTLTEEVTPKRVENLINLRKKKKTNNNMKGCGTSNGYMVKMPLKKFVKEHKDLKHDLKSKEGVKKEAKEQGRELKKVIKKAHATKKSSK